MERKPEKFIIREFAVLAGVVISFFLAAIAVTFGIKFTDTKLTAHEFMALKRLLLWAFGAVYGGYLSFRFFKWFKKTD